MGVTVNCGGARQEAHRAGLSTAPQYEMVELIKVEPLETTPKENRQPDRSFRLAA